MKDFRRLQVTHTHTHLAASCMLRKIEVRNHESYIYIYARNSFQVQLCFGCPYFDTCFKLTALQGAKDLTTNQARDGHCVLGDKGVVAHAAAIVEHLVTRSDNRSHEIEHTSLKAETDVLGLHSLSILFNHRSSQKPIANSPGFGWFPEKKDPWKAWARPSKLSEVTLSRRR